MWCSKQICLSSDDVNIVVRLVAKEIMDHGLTYKSSDLSMNHGQTIKEVWNASVCLTDPRKRILGSGLFPIFNPGLAVARFMYMLSGSNLLDPIAFYTDRVRQFSDDGETIPGSSYGKRIFGNKPIDNQFEIVAKLIAQRPDTKRAVITVYDSGDLERIDSRDIPCAMSIVFMPRGNVLHSTVCMRANDVVKLLPYNIFDFSLLQECMAARVGMEVGSYWHTAVSAHLRGKDFDFIPSFVSEIQQSKRMTPIQSFSEETRKLLVSEEQRIREDVGSLSTLQAALKQVWDEFNPVWADMLSTIACEVLRVRARDNHDTKQDIEEAISNHNRQGALLSSYKNYLSLEKRWA